MSTTLVPPSYYIVKPRGCPARLYNTLTEVAAAIYPLARTAATVSAVTGSRHRSLTHAELRDLGRSVRVLRLRMDNTISAIAAEPIQMRRAPDR